MKMKTVGILFIAVALLILSALGLVVFPTYLYENNTISETEYYVRAIINTLRGLGIALIIGLIGIKMTFSK